MGHHPRGLFRFSFWVRLMLLLFSHLTREVLGRSPDDRRMKRRLQSHCVMKLVTCHLGPGGLIHPAVSQAAWAVGTGHGRN